MIAVDSGATVLQGRFSRAANPEFLVAVKLGKKVADDQALMSWVAGSRIA
jgi:hypothetical protein